MDTNTHLSATIYDFADFAAKIRAERARRAYGDHVVDFPADLPKATFGGAWYHEEAIQGSTDHRQH